MAEEEKNEATEEKKKPPIILFAMIGIVMLLEAVGVFAFVKMSGGGTADAKASMIQGEEMAEQEKTVEIPLWGDRGERFQNLSSGKAWTWTVSVVLQVKKKYEENVNAELERRKAEISEGVALIIRRAAHSHLTEPGLETLHRQIVAYLNEVFGTDPEGEPRIERVLLPKCQGVESVG